MEDAGPSDQVPMNETEDWVSVHHAGRTETDSDVDGQVAASEELSSSSTRASEDTSHLLLASDLETTGAPANVAFSDACSEQSINNPPEDPTPEPVAVGVGDDTRGDAEREHVPQEQDQMSEAPAVTRAWSQAECHMNDIRYAEKATPCIPHRVQKQQLKILVTGQPETGRTTAIKNLFASIVEDPSWSPTDVSGLTMDDFSANPEQFTTMITDRNDTAGHLSISYVIQETPGVKGAPQVVADVLANYLRSEQDAYAAQEGCLDVARGQLKDGRVDCVLYFLPTNARIGESDLDFTVINALAAYAPVIPLMCKADCLEEEEILQRKAELERLQQDGLEVFSFPEDVVGRLTDVAHGLSRSEPPPDELALPAASGPAFRPPFNIVAGTHADLAVHRFWFVRKYRWAECEAYRTSNSDLRLLRQLLMEDGFWCIKDEADACYRRQRKTVPAAAAVAAAPARTSVTAESEGAAATGSVAGKGALGGCGGDVVPGELRHSGRGSRIMPAWMTPQEPAPKAKQPPALYPLAVGAPSLREVVSTKGIGSAARPSTSRPSAAPLHRPSLDGTTQNLLSVSSNDTEFNTLSAADASAALGMLRSSDLKLAPEVPSAASQPGSVANPLAASSSLLAPPAAPMPSAAASEETAEAEESDFDETACVEATVADVQRGLSRDYRLTLRLHENDKRLCMHIGNTEGSCISAALRSSGTSRPSAYDATSELLKALKCKVERVVITECSHTIFYARVYAVNGASRQHVNVDARPSDAINLALRHSAPVFVNKDVARQVAK